MLAINKPNRLLEVEVAGYKSILSVKSSVSNDDIQKAIDYAYSLLCQSCYVEYILADNFLILAKEVFLKKNVFKFGLKHHFNECQKSIRNTMRVYERHMDEGYYNEYSSTLWDMVENEVEKLRKIIEDKLRNLHCKYNPYLCSYVIMIQNLVQQIDDTYIHVMDIVNKEYDVDVRASYSRYRAREAFKQADNCLYDVMKQESEKFTYNIVKNKTIVEIWADITKALYDPKNVKKARLAAFYNMPAEQQQLYNLREDGFCELKDNTKKWAKK